jgi:hypothetical protein
MQSQQQSRAFLIKFCRTLYHLIKTCFKRRQQIPAGNFTSMTNDFLVKVRARHPALPAGIDEFSVSK